MVLFGKAMDCFARWRSRCRGEDAHRLEAILRNVGPSTQVDLVFGDLRMPAQDIGGLRIFVNGVLEWISGWRGELATR